MRIATSNIFQTASFINNKKPFAGAQLNGVEPYKTARTNENDKLQNKKQAKSILETLMEQKQRVAEQKYSLIGRTLEKGGDIKNIEIQIEAYDEQLKAIDSQIASIMAEEAKKQEGKEEYKKSNEPKTKEEAQTAKMLSIISNSDNIAQAELIQSVQGELKGEAKILAREIALDETRGSASESKVAHLAKVEGKIVALQNDVSNMLANINEYMSEIAEIKIKEGEIKEKEENQTENTQNKNTQTENTQNKNTQNENTQNKDNQKYPEIDVYA